MGGKNLIKTIGNVAANVSTGGLYGVGKSALDTATGKTNVVQGVKGALANYGPLGSALTPVAGTDASFKTQAAIAALAGGAAALSGGGAGAGAAGASSESTAVAPVSDSIASGIASGGQQAAGSGVLAPAASAPAAAAPAGTGTVLAPSGTEASATAPSATPAPVATQPQSSGTLEKLAAGASVVGTGSSVAGQFIKPKLPEMPQAPAPPTESGAGDTAAQAAAEARVNDQAKRRTQTLLTGGTGATDYGKNSFAPSLLGNNTYLKSVIG